MYIYYCSKCNGMEQHAKKNGIYHCIECNNDLISLERTTEEWNVLSNNEMLNIIKNAEKRNCITKIKRPVFAEQDEHENMYDFQLIDYADKKVQVAELLRNLLEIEAADAIRRVNSAPNFLFCGMEYNQIYDFLLRMDSLPIEYKLFNGEYLVRHKQKDEITKLFSKDGKLVKCPNCNSYIDEVTKTCAKCGCPALTKIVKMQKPKSDKVRIIIDHSPSYTSRHHSSEPYVYFVDIKTDKLLKQAVAGAEVIFNSFDAIYIDVRTSRRKKGIEVRVEPGKKYRVAWSRGIISDVIASCYEVDYFA